MENEPVNNVHIRYQTRNRKKGYTIVEGLADDLDLKKITKNLKKNLNCNAAVIENSKIQLQGDHRTDVRQFLNDQRICPSDTIIMHGI